MCIFLVLEDAICVRLSRNRRKNTLQTHHQIFTIDLFTYFVPRSFWPTCGTRCVWIHSFTNSERNEIAVCVEDCCLRNADIARHRDTCIYVTKQTGQQRERGKKAKETRVGAIMHSRFSIENTFLIVVARCVRPRLKSPKYFPQYSPCDAEEHGLRYGIYVLWCLFCLGIEFHIRTEEISVRLALFLPTAKLFAWIISCDAPWLRWLCHTILSEKTNRKMKTCNASKIVSHKVVPHTASSSFVSSFISFHPFSTGP